MHSLPPGAVQHSLAGHLTWQNTESKREVIFRVINARSLNGKYKLVMDYPMLLAYFKSKHCVELTLTAEFL